MKLNEYTEINFHIMAYLRLWYGFWSKHSYRIYLGCVFKTLVCKKKGYIQPLAFIRPLYVNI